MRKDLVYLSALEKRMDDFLITRGFARAKEEGVESKKLITTWIKPKQWKADMVKLVSPKAFDGVRGHVQVLLEIQLLYPTGDFGLFTGTNIADVLGRSNPYYYFPIVLSILAETRLSKFTKRLVSDTEAALSWFKALDSPGKCLALLASGQTAVGPIRERGAARAAWEFLSSLGSSAPPPS